MTKIKHATAGAFVFCEVDGVWHLGLIEHPRLLRMMIPGGHVEADEHCAQAAVREIAEETGLLVDLLPAPVAVPLPRSYPHPLVAPPWWITEIHVPADNHTPVAHVHIDHQYVAFAKSARVESEPAHPFGWYPSDRLDGLRMFEDTRLLARALFGCVEEMARGHRGTEVVAALAHV